MNTNFWSTAYEAVKEVVLPVIPSLLGAVVSLQFLGRGLSMAHKLSSVGVGVVCAAYVSPVLVDWLGVQGKELHASLEFLIARTVGRTPSDELVDQVSRIEQKLYEHLGQNGEAQEKSGNGSGAD